MRLNKIVVAGADGLKGQRFVEQVEPAVVFTGPNGAGKSTRLIAVLAGLRGLAGAATDSSREYLGPDLPDTMVDLAWDDGTTMRRELTKQRGKIAERSDQQAVEVAGAHLVRWDLGDFVRDTDSGRTKLIERVCSSSTVTPDDIDRKVVEALQIPITGDHMAHRLRPQRSTDGATYLAAYIAAARAAYTDANARKKQADAGADAQVGERNGQTSAPDIAAARARLDRAQAEVTRLASAKRAAEQSSAALAAWTRDRDRAARDIAEADARLAELDAIRAPGEFVRPSDEAQQAELQRAARARADSNGQVSDAEAQVAAAQAKVELLTKLATDGGGKCCRACGAADPLNLALRVEAAGMDMEGAVDDLAAAKEAAVKAEADFQRANQALTEAVNNRKRAESEHRAASVRYDEAQAEIARITTRRDRLIAELSDSQEPPAADGASDDLTAEVDAASAELAAARQELESVTRAAERERALQNAIVEREEARVAFEQVSALGQALKAIREEVTKDAYGPLTDEANRLLKRAGSDLRASFESSSLYGASRDGGPTIHFAALSDAERATVGAALCYAMARLSGARWRAVVLDRMEVVDDTRLPGLVSALRAAVQDGEIDNFIGAYTCLTPPPTLKDIARHLA